MKFFAILFAIVAVSSMAKADDDSLARIAEPLLRLLQPLLSGLNNGLQCGAVQIGKGVHQIGSCAQSAVSGVGDVVAKGASGLGGTVNQLPGALYHTTKNLQKHTGLVGNALDTVTGACSSSHSH